MSSICYTLLPSSIFDEYLPTHHSDSFWVESTQIEISGLLKIYMRLIRSINNSDAVHTKFHSVSVRQIIFACNRNSFASKCIKNVRSIGYQPKVFSWSQILSTIKQWKWRFKSLEINRNFSLQTLYQRSICRHYSGGSFLPYETYGLAIIQK